MLRTDSGKRQGKKNRSCADEISQECGCIYTYIYILKHQSRNRKIGSDLNGFNLQCEFGNNEKE